MATRAERRELRRLYEETGSVLAVARRLRWSTTTVRRRLAEYGIAINRPGRPRKTMTPASPEPSA